jgi:hypothetical protein
MSILTSDAQAATYKSVVQEDRKLLREQQARMPAQRPSHTVSRCLLMGASANRDELADRIAELVCMYVCMHGVFTRFRTRCEQLSLECVV